MVVVQVVPVVLPGLVIGTAVVVVLARSCRCRRRSHSYQVCPGPRYDTTWSITFLIVSSDFDKSVL